MARFTKADRDLLGSAINDMLAGMGMTMDGIGAAYSRGEFPRSADVKDLSVRFRWDLYYATMRYGARMPDTDAARWVETVDARDNVTSAHIDTALRAVVPTIERKF